MTQLFLDRPQYTGRAASIDSQLQCKSPMSTGTYDQLLVVHLDLDPQQRLQGSSRHLEQFLKDETPPGGPSHCHYKVPMFSFHDATTLGSRFCSNTMLLLPRIHGGHQKLSCLTAVVRLHVQWWWEWTIEEGPQGRQPQSWSPRHGCIEAAATSSATLPVSNEDPLSFRLVMVVDRSME